MRISKEKTENSSWYKIGKFILTSVPFALLLSIAFFWYEMWKNDKENDEMISNLQEIERSLSTQHIGIFPEYKESWNIKR